MRRQPTLLLKKSLLSELTVTLVAVDIHEPSGAKGMIQDSIKTGKVKISVALESARSGHVARAAINAALLLVAGDDEVGAAGPMDVDHQEYDDAPTLRKRGRADAIDIAVVGCASVCRRLCIGSETCCTGSDTIGTLWIYVPFQA
jgi:hypothetical protein